MPPEGRAVYNYANVNMYDANKNRTRTILRSQSAAVQIVPQPGEKYLRIASAIDIFNNNTFARPVLTRLADTVFPVTIPLQQIQLIPNSINTIDVLTTVKPLDMYVETVVPPDPDPDDPMSEYTGIIYNDGVLDVTQEDPNALNELTIHFRDNVDKTITIPATPLEPATTTTLGGVIVGDGLSVDQYGEISVDEMTGADGTNAGTAGIVPAPSATDNNKFLRGDGTWVEVEGGGGVVYSAGDGIEIVDDRTRVGFDREHVRNLSYFFDTQVQCKISHMWGSTRIYTKLTSEKALGAIVTRYFSGYSNPLSGPLFVSTIETAVGYGTNYDSRTFLAEPTTFEYLGLTWYYTNLTDGNNGYYEEYNGISPDMLGNMTSLGTIYPAGSSIVDIAKDIIDSANLASVGYVINAKIGNGLHFDENNAIAVDSVSPQYVRVNTSDSYVLLHTEPSDWDDSWYNYYMLEYDELTSSPPDWDPTKHYKYENDNYVLGSPGDTFVSTTWYDKHYKGLDPNTPVVFDSDVYYTDQLHLIEDGETFDTAFEKVNEAIEHIERLEKNVQFLHDNKVDVRETTDPERIEFYYS
jgi:hypothetical protein